MKVKRVLLYLGMGSCVSTKNVEPPSMAMEVGDCTVKTPVWEAAGSKEEMFFDSKPWLDSDDEDFLSVNGDNSPLKQVNKNNGDHQGRKLSELFMESSFSSDSQTSLKAREEGGGKDDVKPTNTSKWERRKSGKSVKRCLPSLVRSLSCGDRKKRLSPSHIAVVG